MSLQCYPYNVLQYNQRNIFDSTYLACVTRITKYKYEKTS